MDAIAEIKKLYYDATRATIVRDLARAVALLKTLPDEDARERAAVYMDGLSQMKAEWLGRGAAPDQTPRNAGRGRRPKRTRATGGTTPRSRG